MARVFQQTARRKINEFNEDPFAPRVFLRAPPAFFMMMLRQPSGCDRHKGTNNRAA